MNKRADDRDRHDRGRPGRADQGLQELAEAERAIEAHRQQQGVGRGDGRRLGRRDGARIDAAQQDHRQEQGRERVADGRQELGARDRLLDRKIAPLRDEMDQHHQHRPHEQAGQHAGDEQVADRGVGDHGVQHHRDRGRDDRPDRGRGRGHRTREARCVACIAQHQVDHQLAGAGGIGQGAAAHAREDDAEHDVDLGEAAAQPADQQRGEAQQALADSTRVHDLGGEDEHRHREQHEALEQPVQALIGEQPHVLAGDQEVEEPRGDHREADRHADRGPAEEADEHQAGGEAHSLATVPRASRRRAGASGARARTARSAPGTARSTRTRC